ncbi:hypothetical protein BS17DRAFT_780714 [Gyrodon lividus]|nr:hypothetical protein BS17DRAFT_780714 [Gyrodon lividus]
MTDSQDSHVSSPSPISGTPALHVYHELVLNKGKSKLCAFSCMRELVQAIHDALVGRSGPRAVSRDVGHDV